MTPMSFGALSPDTENDKVNLSHFSSKGISISYSSRLTIFKTGCLVIILKKMHFIIRNFAFSYRFVKTRAPLVEDLIIF